MLVLDNCNPQSVRLSCFKSKKAHHTNAMTLASKTLASDHWNPNCNDQMWERMHRTNLIISLELCQKETQNDKHHSHQNHLIIWAPQISSKATNDSFWIVLHADLTLDWVFKSNCWLLPNFRVVCAKHQHNCNKLIHQQTCYITKPTQTMRRKVVMLNAKSPLCRAWVSHRNGVFAGLTLVLNFPWFRTKQQRDWGLTLTANLNHPKLSLQWCHWKARCKQFNVFWLLLCFKASLNPPPTNYCSTGHFRRSARLSNLPVARFRETKEMAASESVLKI